MAYVQSSGAMASILHLLTDTEDPGFSLLCGSALRLLASIARQQGRGGDLQSFVPVLKVVEQLLESRDESCAVHTTEPSCVTGQPLTVASDRH